MDDFDIYGDLEHIESEAKKESKELHALQDTINQLQEKIDAVEQEKKDILKKNDILLENVSSLLLTAKAELKRKDAIISDLRKQCDNTVFRRGNIANKGKKGIDRFTQTPARKLTDTAIQTALGEENDPLWHKKRNNIDTEPERYRERHERESQRDSKKGLDDRQIRDCDKSTGRERVRQRNEDRNRDRYRDSDGERGRYRDSDGERDRDRYRDSDGERNRDRVRSSRRRKSREGKRMSEYHSYERSRDRTTHDLDRKNDRKRSKDRSSKQACNEKNSDDHTRTSEFDQLNKCNTRSFDYKAESLPSRSNSNEACISSSPEDFGQDSVNPRRLTDKHSGLAIDSKANVVDSGISLLKRHATKDIGGHNEPINIRPSKESNSERRNDQTALDIFANSANLGPNKIISKIETSTSTKNVLKQKYHDDEADEQTNKNPSVKKKISDHNSLNCDDHAHAVEKSRRKNYTHESVSKTATYVASKTASEREPKNKRCLNESYDAEDCRTEKLAKPSEPNITSDVSISNRDTDAIDCFLSWSHENTHLTSQTSKRVPNAPIDLDNEGFLDFEKSYPNKIEDNDNHSGNESKISATKATDKMEKKDDSRKSLRKQKTKSKVAVVGSPKQKQCIHPTPKNAEGMSTQFALQAEETPSDVALTSMDSTFHSISSETANLTESGKREAEDQAVDRHFKAIAVGNADNINEMNELPKQNRPNDVEASKDNISEYPETMSVPPIIEKTFESKDISQNNSVPTTTTAVTNNETHSMGSVNRNAIEGEQNNCEKLVKERAIRKNSQSKSQQTVSSRASKNKISIKSPKHDEVKLTQNVSQRQQDSSNLDKGSLNRSKKISDDSKRLTCTTKGNNNKHETWIEATNAAQKTTNHDVVNDNVESSNVLTVDHVAKEGKTTSEATIAPSAADTDVTNDKQSLPSDLNVLSSEKSTRSSFGLRSRRAKSCYIEPGSDDNDASTSLEAFLMNFDGNDSVVETKDTPSSSAEPCVAELLDAGSGSSPVVMNVAPDSICDQQPDHTEVEADKTINQKSKTCSLDNIRERLRKKQNATSTKTQITRDKSPRVANYPKRRLSVESSPILSNKKHKSDIDLRAGSNKLLTSPTAGCLSSPYFSQIALPITSALDSIPSKLRSPSFKRTVETVMTPMVVVHSPAKPSDQATLYNDLEVFANPADDYSSLEQIMDSLFRTPIKNEPSNNGSPPNADELDTNDKEQNVISTDGISSHSLIAYSTPLSTKPLSRFDNKSVVERKDKNPSIPVPVRSAIGACELYDRRENVDTNRMVSTTRFSEKPSDSEPVAKDIDERPETHQDFNKSVDKSSTNRASKPLNENSNHKTKTLPSTATVTTVQQSIKCSIPSASKPMKVDNMHTASLLTVFKTPVSVRSNTEATKQAMDMQRDVKDDQKNRHTKVEHWKSPKVSVGGASVANSGKESIVPSVSNCTNDTLSNNINACSSNNSDGKNSNEQIASRNVEHFEEKNHSDNKESKPIKAAIEKSVPITNQIDAYDRIEPRSSKSDYKSQKSNNQNLGQTKPPLSLGKETLEKNSSHQTQKRPMSIEEVSTDTVEGTVDKPTGLVSSTGVEESASSKLSSCNVNLSLTDYALTNSSQNIRKRQTAAPPTQPVRYVREMRIVKESPSLMRVFIRRK